MKHSAQYDRLIGMLGIDSSQTPDWVIDELEQLGRASMIMGFVYIIRSSHGYFKIGRTKRLRERIRTLGVTLPFPISPIHTIACDDSVYVEQFYHGLFSMEGKRLAGEWFRLTDDDIETLKMISFFRDGAFYDHNGEML